MVQAGPPRPIEPGDIVAGYSDELGEWAAAQVTHVGSALFPRTAGVLQLTWSGPEPTSLDDLGRLEPLRLTHHAHTGRLAYSNVGWLLPRSCRVIGRAPVLVDTPADSYAGGWQLGSQLARQRRWDAGERDSGQPGHRTISGSEFNEVVEPVADVWSLTIEPIDRLDCAAIGSWYPQLTRLSLTGDLGSLANASALNQLGQLRVLMIDNLFGMTAADCVLPDRLARLDALYLHSVPAAHARATRRAWTPEIEHGTDLQITGPRNDHWAAENRDNPLREWDGRDQVSPARYQKAVAQYRRSRAAILEALQQAKDPDALVGIGREFAEFFNQLDGSRSQFIETVERDELFAALVAAVEFGEQRLGRSFPEAANRLSDGVQLVRRW